MDFDPWPGFAAINARTKSMTFLSRFSRKCANKWAEVIVRLDDPPCGYIWEPEMTYEEVAGKHIVTMTPRLRRMPG